MYFMIPVDRIVSRSGNQVAGSKEPFTLDYIHNHILQMPRLVAEIPIYAIFKWLNVVETMQYKGCPAETALSFVLLDVASQAVDLYLCRNI